MGHINLHWWDKELNVGDQLNPYLIAKLTGESKEVKWVDRGFQESHYLSIGSILDRANKFSTVWGSGILAEQTKFLPKEMPESIKAVRGPLTKSYLVKNKIDCPEIYGDPAILTSKVYHPKSLDKKYKFGVIPHFVDQNKPIIRKIEKLAYAKVIDVRTKDIEGFIDELTSCEVIFSSSLHGLIFADSYAVPNLWTTFNSYFWNRSKVVGNGFKFRDYFLSVNRKQEKPINLNKIQHLERFASRCEKGEISNLIGPLLEVMPFS